VRIWHLLLCPRRCCWSLAHGWVGVYLEVYWRYCFSDDVVAGQADLHALVSRRITAGLLPGIGNNPSATRGLFEILPLHALKDIPNIAWSLRVVRTVDVRRISSSKHRSLAIVVDRDFGSRLSLARLLSMSVLEVVYRGRLL